jgi:hypothetical protein
LRKSLSEPPMQYGVHSAGIRFLTMERSAGQDYRCSEGCLTCAIMLLVQDWQETVYSTDVAEIGLVHHHKAGA